MAFIFVMFLNVFMFLSQASMLAMNPDSPQFYTGEGTVIAELQNGNITTTGSNIYLPEGQNIEITSGNPFTDIFNNALSWFKGTKGGMFTYTILASPYNILKATGLPSLFVATLGTLWYGISLFLLVAFIWGRGN